MKNTLCIFFAFSLALTAFGQRYSSLTSTNSVVATNLLAIEIFPNATNGTKSISVSNFARSIGPYLTNSFSASATNAVSTVKTNGAAVSTVATSLDIISGTNVVTRATNSSGAVTIEINATGGLSGLTTNGNQFGASSALTLKSSPLLTNINSYGTLQALGLIDAEGGINIGNLTPSMALVINGSGDIANSAAVDTTEIEYVDGATNNIQSQINLLKLAVTNLGRILFVHPQGATVGVRGSVPWNSLSNAAIAALGGDTIFILAATNDVFSVTNAGIGGVNITNKTGDITLTGFGMSSYLQSDEEGTAIYANDIRGKLTISNFRMRGVRQTNFSAVAETHFLCGIRLGGNLGPVDVSDLYVDSFQRFAVGFIQDATDNPYTNRFRAWNNTMTNCGTWVPGVARYDGSGLQLAGKTEVWNNDIIACARGIELYGYDAGGTHTRSGPHRIFGNRIRNWLDGAIITGSFTNNADVAIYDNESIQDLGYSRDTSNALDVAHFQLSVIDGLTVRNNLIANGRSGIEAFTSAIRPLKPTIVEGNFLYGQHAPLVFGDATSGASAGMIGLQVRRNFIGDAGGRGIQMIGVRDSSVEFNTIHNVSTNGSLEAIYLAGVGTLAHGSNVTVRENVVRDRSGTVGALYGINIAAGAVGTIVDNNQFEDFATAAISDAGTNTLIRSLTTTGQGIGTNAPAARLHIHGRAYINGTNAASAFHLTGGQATNSLLYIDGGTNIGPAIIGSGLSFTAGTLAVTGSGAATNALNSLGTNAVGDVVASGMTNLLFATGSNVVVHASNSPAGSVTLRVRTTGELNNWAAFPTNTMNSNALNAVLSFGSNQVRVTAGANITVTPSGSGNVMSYSIAGSAGGGGGTNYPPTLNLLGGTNIAVGSGVRQSWTLTTNATFNLNFQGTALNGEAIRVAVSNYSSSAIYMTNRQGGTIAAVFQPALGSNNSVFAIAPNSISIFDFAWSTNFNNGAVRQELQWSSQLEPSLAVGTAHLTLVTNTAQTVITLQVTNHTGSGGLVASNGATIFNPSIDLSGNIVTNVGQLNWLVETRLIATNSATSNLVFNFATTNSVDLFLTNNATLTNWSGLAAGTSPSKTVWITPQLIPRGINWGNLGGSNPGYAVAIYTNVNSPMWTTLTNGKTYVLTITAKGTNLFPTLTLWE